MHKKYDNAKWMLLTILGILVISIFVFRRYLFEGYYFFSQGMLSDLLRANIPTYYQMYDSITNGGIYWSWKMGIGTSMFTHADVYFDPFTYIVFLLGRDGIPQMMIWVLIIKIIAQGLSIFSYLDYFKLNKYAVAVGSITYAFCGYSLITGSNLALGTILVYTPLVFRGIEKWLNEKKLFLLIFSLFLTCIYSYYYFYAIGLLACGYLITRLIQKKEKIIPYLIILGICGILTILLGAFSLWPQVELVLNAPRVSSQSDVETGFILFIPQLKVWFTALARTIGNELLGNPFTGLYYGCAFNESRDFFQITTYSSTFFIILTWTYWVNEKEHRKNFLIIFGVLSLMAVFPIVSFVFNAFSTINTRWMFIFSIVEALLISLSIDSLIRNQGLKIKVLLQGIAISYISIFSSYITFSIGTISFKWSFLNYLLIPKKFIFMISILYCGLLCVCFIMNYKRITPHIKKPLLCICIFFLMALDIAGNYYHWFSSEDAVCHYSEECNSSYEDTSAKIIRQIKANDNSFYRLFKDFDSVYDLNQIPSENDAMVQNYYGLKSYNSINNPEYIQFLQEVGIYVCCPLNTNYFKENSIRPEQIAGQDLNYIDGVENDPWLMDYLGVKYFISKTKSYVDESYQYVYEENGINVFINENAYPLAFVNEKLMHFDDFNELSDSEKRLALLNYTIVYNSDETTELYDSDLSENNLKESVQTKNNAFSLINFTENEVSFSIDVKEDNQYISMSIPYDKNWHIYVDDNEVSTEKINISLLGTKVNSGTHIITIKYIPSVFFSGIWVSILTAIILCVCYLINRKVNFISTVKFVEAIGYINEKILHIIIYRLTLIIHKNSFKYLIRFVCSIIFVIVTIYFISPTTFLFTQRYDYNIKDILLGDNEETYVTDENGYLKLDFNSCINYNLIRISFSGVNSIEVTLQKTSEEDTVCWTQYATNRNPVLLFKANGSIDDKIMITIRSSPNTAIALSSVQLEYTTISVNVYLLVGIVICSLFCSIILAVFFRKNRDITQHALKRESNIELCRIICMFFVVLHHYAIHGGSFNLPVTNTNMIYSLFLIPGGKLGFDCFLAISCWFLVDQEFRTKRFIRMWLLVLFYSVTFSIITFLMGGYFSFANWMSIILPISGNSHGFASAYLALYLLLPFLAKMTDKLTKYQARWLMILLFFFEVITQLIGAYTQYYQKLASELLVFVLCYVIAINLKRWPVKIIQNKRVMLTLFISIWLLLWVFQCSYVKHPDNQLLRYLKSTMEDESSITNLIGGFAFFLFFKDIRIKPNWFINILATGTFGILLIHDHNFFRYVFWDKVIHTPDFYYSNNLILHSFIASIWIFISGFVIDKLREYLLERNILKSNFLNKLCRKCDSIIYPSMNEIREKEKT